jgi:hypothetical protein
MGDTHIGTHKHKIITKKAKSKKTKRVLGSDDETPSPGQSLKYQESNDSTSATDTDDGGGDGGSQYRIEPSGGGTHFTCEKHKLCTYVHLSFSYMTNTTLFCRRGELYSCHAR